MKLQKIPIDYSKAGTGEVPFDGKKHLFHSHNGDIDTGYWQDCNERFSRLHCGAGYQIWKLFSNSGLPTHYTPMPQFEEVKGGEV